MNDLAEAARRYPSERLLQVRHEDVVTDVEGTMARLCRWLDLSPHPSLRETTMLGQPWSHNSSFGSGEAGTSELPTQRGSALSEAERRYFAWATEPFRAHFGYL